MRSGRSKSGADTRRLHRRWDDRRGAQIEPCDDGLDLANAELHDQPIIGALVSEGTRESAGVTTEVKEVVSLSEDGGTLTAGGDALGAPAGAALAGADGVDGDDPAGGNGPDDTILPIAGTGGGITNGFLHDGHATRLPPALSGACIDF